MTRFLLFAFFYFFGGGGWGVYWTIICLQCFQWFFPSTEKLHRNYWREYLWMTCLYVLHKVLRVVLKVLIQQRSAGFIRYIWLIDTLWCDGLSACVHSAGRLLPDNLCPSRRLNYSCLWHPKSQDRRRKTDVFNFSWVVIIQTYRCSPQTKWENIPLSHDLFVICHQNNVRAHTCRAGSLWQLFGVNCVFALARMCWWNCFGVCELRQAKRK